MVFFWSIASSTKSGDLLIPIKIYQANETKNSQYEKIPTEKNRYKKENFQVLSKYTIRFEKNRRTNIASREGIFIVFKLILGMF